MITLPAFEYEFIIMKYVCHLIPPLWEQLSLIYQTSWSNSITSLSVWPKSIYFTTNECQCALTRTTSHTYNLYHCSFKHQPSSLKLLLEHAKLKLYSICINLDLLLNSVKDGCVDVNEEVAAGKWGAELSSWEMMLGNIGNIRR